MKHLYTVLTVLLFVGLIKPGAALSQQAQVVQSARHNTSVPLRSMTMPASTNNARAPYEVPNKLAKVGGRTTSSADKTGFTDPVRQQIEGTLAPTIGANFEGSSDDDNSAVIGFRVVPPDTDGDVGPNHYVQWINSITEIFDKSGNTLFGPAAGNVYFQGLGGDCESNNNGDPVVLYDELADRWLVSQFAVDASPYSMCVAISQTSDPTGAYHQYEFDFGSDFPDYPKLAIWGDSYTMTTRDFANGSFFAGISAVAMDRDAMLNGDPTTMVRFDNAFGGTSIDGYLPADADGAISGAPLFGGHGDDGNTTFELWELDVDWNNPNAASFNSISGVGISAYDGVVPQADQPNGQGLDDLSFFTMHRLHVRDFGSHVSMVANHTVETDPGTAGIRWYEFRNTGGNWTLYQEGTYSPDSDDRWMGSIAINAAGDISLGYSRSSTSLFPSIYFTGQTADQSGSGVMNVEETLIHAGAGSQSGASRWGDYSMMSVDPSDDSFWFTTEYYDETNSFDFKTRIASYVLDGEPGGNNNPVASFTSSCTLLSCDFTDTSTDSDGSIVSWDWDFGDGNSSSAQNPSHSYSANGTYTVMLTVTDDMGGTGSTSQSVTVNDGTGTTTMHVEAISGATLVRGGGGGTAEVTVTIEDADGNPVEDATVVGLYSGDVSGEPIGSTDSNGEVVLVSDQFSSRPGTVELCVSNVTHGSLTYNPADNADASFACESVSGPPNAAFTFSTNDLTVDFNDASTDDGSVVSWSWDFGDGNSSTSQNPSHTYAADGTYTVTLTVTDNDGETDSASESVTVSTGGGGGETMHVEAISGATLVRAGGSGTAEVTVTIEDADGNPVANATVDGEFGGDVNGSPSGVTDSNGEVVLVSEAFFSRPGTVELCVDDVTHASLTYDPADNADPGFDCSSAAPSQRRDRVGNVFSETPIDFELQQNYPNPFNPTTIISYGLPEATRVQVRVYNMLGQVVATVVDEYQTEGRYNVSFNANEMSAGVYLYTIETGTVKLTKRMTLLK